MKNNTSSKVIGVIPARYASTRFPGKLLHLIQGKTLLQRTLENARKAAFLENIVIATDHPKIAEEAERLSCPAIMTSPNCRDGTERIIEALKAPLFKEAEIIVNIQGDEPCLAPATINSVIKALQADAQASVSTVVSKIENEEDLKNPSIVKCVFNHKGYALYFSRYPIPFDFDLHFKQKKSLHTDHYRHIGLYCYRKEFLLKYSEFKPTPLQCAENLEQLKVLEWGYNIKVSVVKDTSIGVDLPEDILKVEKFLCHQNTSSSPEESSPH